MTKCPQFNQPTAGSVCFLFFIVWNLSSSFPLQLDAGWAADPSESLTASISATSQDLDLGANRVHAEGNVRLEYKDIQLCAEQLDVDLKTESIAASGNIKVTRKEGLLEGERFTYHFPTSTGMLDDAKVTFEHINFRGTRLKLKGNVVTINGATGTTCSKEGTPHYRVTCRKVVYLPGRRVEFSHTSIWLGTVKIISVAHYARNLTEEAYEQTVIPRVYVNRTDGVLAQTALSYPLARGVTPPTLGLTVGLSAREGLRGNAGVAARSRKVAYGVKVAVKDVVTEDLTSRILLNKSPEAFLNINGLSLNKRLVADFFASAGDYHEPEPTDARSKRANLALRLTPKFGTATKPSPVFGSVFARKSWYEDGVDYRVLGGSIGIRGKVSSRLSGSVQYLTHGVSGATPFEFDDIDILHELRTTSDFTLSRKWKVPLELRYDLDRDSFRKGKFGILRVLDCVEYGATYDTSRREFGIAVRVVGFEP